MIKNEKTLKIIYGICVGQFALAMILTSVVSTLDKKLVMLASAILGILAAGAARRSYIEFQVNESNKSVDPNFLKDNKGT